jgi:hypothetical protein
VTRRSAASIEAEHRESHGYLPDFDFFCVAHGPDYSPKYLDYETCHSSWDEGLCHPDCRICPIRCPHSPCPWGEE